MRSTLFHQLRSLAGDTAPQYVRRAHRHGRIHPSLWNGFYLHLRALARAVADAELACDGVILDIGAGDTPYRQLIEGQQYIAMDISTERQPTLVSDAHTLPFADASIDMVVSFQAFEHLRRPSDVIREIVRVLKPRGRVAISTHGLFPHHGNDYHRWTAEGLALLTEHLESVAIRPLGGPLTVSTLLTIYTLRELACSAAPGAPRVASRLGAAAVASVANAATLVAEQILARSSVYRRLTLAATDAYLITGRKPAEPASDREEPAMLAALGPLTVHAAEPGNDSHD